MQKFAFLSGGSLLVVLLGSIIVDPAASLSDAMDFASGANFGSRKVGYLCLGLIH